jgi:CDK-activating kinase assembly factor MAT1
MIAFNLVNGIDVKETEAKIAAYEYTNRQSIASNAARGASETAALTRQEEFIRRQREQARILALKEEADEQYERERQKTDLIRDLVWSPAQLVSCDWC